jgi:hypothetical protein
MALCAAHKYHWPKPLTVEEHHIIPQAWQEHFAEGGQRVILPSMVPDEELGNYGWTASHLWHKETVTLCPTGHRNVHYYLVRLMKNSPKVESLQEVRTFTPGKGREYEIACRAILLWKSSPGRTLQSLRDLKLWGQA